MSQEILEFRNELKEHLEAEFMRIFPDSKVPYVIEKVIFILL